MRVALAIFAAVVVLYLLDQLYWWVARMKAKNIGIFRDDRRENDMR